MKVDDTAVVKQESKHFSLRNLDLQLIITALLSFVAFLQSAAAG